MFVWVASFQPSYVIEQKRTEFGIEGGSSKLRVENLSELASTRYRVLWPLRRSLIIFESFIGSSSRAPDNQSRRLRPSTAQRIAQESSELF